METEKNSDSKFFQNQNISIINSFNLEKEDALRNLPLNVKLDSIKDYLTSLQNT